MAVESPSTTTRGQAWISNFPAEDRQTARLLLDALRFVPIGVVRRNLRLRLEALVAEGKIELPAMLVAALSIEDLRQKEWNDPHPVAYESFSLDEPISAMPGSEGFVGNLIRELAVLRRAEGWLPPTTTLDDLRNKRCRSIVILTDYAGSGRQLRQFAQAIVRNPTIRSWRSYGWIRIHGVSFAASQLSYDVVTRAKSPVDEMWIGEVAPSFADAPWTDEQRSAVEAICRLYIPKRRRDQALGFQGSGGLFATDVSVPNNIPLILRRTGTGWHPFFEGRTVPPDLAAELLDFSPVLKASKVAQRSGQLRLSANVEQGRRRLASSQLLLILAMLGRGGNSPRGIAREMALPVADVESRMASLLAMGLIDEHGTVLDAGRRELQVGKRSRRKVSANLVGSADEYYPQTMR